MLLEKYVALFMIYSLFGLMIIKVAKDSTEEIISKVRNFLRHNKILSSSLTNVFQKFK